MPYPNRSDAASALAIASGVSKSRQVLGSGLFFGHGSERMIGETYATDRAAKTLWRWSSGVAREAVR